MYLFVALTGKFIRKWRLEKLDVTQCLTAEWSGINHFFSLHLRIEIGTNRNFGHFIFAWLFPLLLVSYSLLSCVVSWLSSAPPTWCERCKWCNGSAWVSHRWKWFNLPPSDTLAAVTMRPPSVPQFRCVGWVQPAIDCLWPHSLIHSIY